jgi:proline-specific peptidase
MAVEGRIPFRGYTTWYRVVGEDAPGRLPLLCLHGGPGSTHHYFEPLERLAAAGRRVIVYDQLGCGASSRPEDPTVYSLELFLDELDVLRAALDLERVHLLGTSWGGMLALEHVLARPESVAGLVLSSTPVDSAGWSREAARLRDQLPSEQRAALTAGRPGEPAYDEAERAFDAQYFHRSEPPHPAIARLRAERGREAYEAMWGPNEWTPTGPLRDWDASGRLGEIETPTLVVSGRYDLCTPAIAARLTEGLPNATHVLCEHSSHTPVLEETERYLTAIGSFLLRVEAAVGAPR